MIRPVPIPSGSALAAFDDGANYVDCFGTVSARPATLEEFIAAFYTTPLFRLEAVILRAVGHGSTKEEARDLAAGRRDTYAAWTVEDRRDASILLRDASGRTLSWLAVDGPQILFGSVVVAVDANGKRDLGRLFRLLLPFHKIYARALLWSAARRLARR